MSLPQARRDAVMPRGSSVGLEGALPRVSVIIAAYNEELRIEQTLLSLLDSGFPCQIIVVDDGSTDGTRRILGRYRDHVRVIEHERNRGKGAAIATGLKAASGDIIVFLDAHLRGLNGYHLLALVLPLFRGEAREVLGVDVPRGFSFMQILWPGAILTGQRAYHKSDLMPWIAAIGGLGYGLETFLYSKFPAEERAVVLLPGLVHLLKKDTAAPSAMVSAYAREIREIIQTIARMKGFPPLDELRRKRLMAAQIAMRMRRGP
jgi:hypothetical protein